MDTENNIPSSALELIYLRNEFYKRKFFVAAILLALSILVNIGAISVLGYLLKNPPHPLYFVADSVGRLMQDIPVNAPNMTTEEAMAWAIDAVQTAYTMDYSNYRAELQNAQKYFTDYGWRNYMQGLTSSRNLDALTQRKYIQIASVVSRPDVLAEGLMGGHYAYKFHMKLYVVFWEPPYKDADKFNNANAFEVVVIVRREPLLQSYKGLGVVQMNATFAS